MHVQADIYKFSKCKYVCIYTVSHLKQNSNPFKYNTVQQKYVSL